MNDGPGGHSFATGGAGSRRPPSSDVSAVRALLVASHVHFPQRRSGVSRILSRVATVEVPSPSVIVQREPAGGRRPHELRRLLVDRAREDEDYSVDIAYHADRAGHVGRDRGPRVREIGDAVPAHAPGDPKHLRERPRGGWRARTRPSGRNFWHFACAASNAGHERSVPAGIWKPPLALGSGKLGTPWERMHCENFNSCEAISAGATGPDDPDVCDEAGGCVAVVGPRIVARPVLDETSHLCRGRRADCATPGPVEGPSPQADKPPAASPRAGNRDGREPARVPVLRNPPSPSWLVRPPHLLGGALNHHRRCLSFRSFECSLGPSEAIVRDRRSHRGHSGRVLFAED